MARFTGVTPSGLYLASHAFELDPGLFAGTVDIGIDLDGCLYDFVTILGDFAAGYFNRPRESFPPAQCWNFFSEQWDLTLDEFLDVFAAGVKAGVVLWSGSPFPTVKSTWEKLRAAGHRLHILTDRSPRGAEDEAHEATRHWLAKNGLVYDTITFTRDKTEVCDIAASDTVVFLEDRIENVQALRDAGVHAYCQRRPWNEGNDFDYVNSFREFGKKVELLAAATL